MTKTIIIELLLKKTQFRATFKCCLLLIFNMREEIERVKIDFCRLNVIRVDQELQFILSSYICYMSTHDELSLDIYSMFAAAVIPIYASNYHK